jgi:hypothetical protein
MRNHFIASLILFPVILLGGEIFKYFISPYLIYMLWQREFKFIPALMVFSATGNTASFVILLGCLIISVLNYKTLIFYNVNKLFILCIGILPIFIANSLIRNVILRQTVLEIISFNFYYLGLFPFFYFLTIKNARLDILYEYIFYMSLFTITFQMLGLLLIDGVVGTIYLAIPFFVSHLFIFFIQKRAKIAKDKLLIFLPLAILSISGIINLTTTILFSSIISAFLVLYYFKFNTIPKKFPLVFVVLTFVLVLYAIYDFDPKKNITSFSDSIERELNAFDIESIIQRASFKFTEDRAPLWHAVFHNYVIDGGLWPVLLNEQLLIDVSYHDSSNIDSNLAAHNIYLELIRNYGLIAGVVISISFIIMIFLGSKPLSEKNVFFPSIVLSSIVLGIGYYSSMAGQFPLTGFFSFIFLGISGANFKFYKERNDS